MARINYKVDQELALQGFLRVAVVAKALNVAPKTVNAWTKYPVSKIGGVKYLTWHEVISDKPVEHITYSLSYDANEVYKRVLLTGSESALTQSIPTIPTIKPQVVTKTNDALAKAKALLVKKEPNVLVKEWNIPLSEALDLIQIPEEILTPQPQDPPELLTIHPDYKHLLRKVK